MARQSLLILAFGIVALVITRWVRIFAARSMLDLPNDRSMHTTPTPRGGGIAIVISVLGGVLAGYLLGWIEGHLAAAVIVGGIATALVGWLDDRRGVRAAIRAAVHVASAGWAVWQLGGMPVVQLGATSLRLGLAGDVLAALGVAWCINLYNFMDGIDGIAGIEALTVGLSACAGFAIVGLDSLAIVSGLVAAAAAGFLPWNWSPAKIFMGDVGSGFLGFVFGCLTVAAERFKGGAGIAMIVLLGAFVFDATVTLLRRLLRGERVYSAHRSHAYQRAVQAGASHSTVSGSIAVINVALALTAAAWLARPFSGILILALLPPLIAYIGVERAKPM